MSSYFTTDGLRALIVLVFAIGQALMAYWPDLRKWPETITTRSGRYSTPIVPIGWAFAFWGLIFLSCLGFAIWHALPGNLDDPLLRTLGWLAAAIFATNVAWEYHVPKRDIDWISVGLIVFSLILLLGAIFIITSSGRSGWAHFALVSLPFQLFAGWISAATFVNLSSTLKRAGAKLETGPCLVLLAMSLLVAGTAAALTGMLLYAAAFAWALFGVFIANRGDSGNQTIKRTTALLIPIVPAIALLAP